MSRAICYKKVLEEFIMSSESKTQEINLRALVDAAKRHLSEIGYQPNTIRRFGSEWSSLIKYADANAIDAFSMELGRSFIWECRGCTLGDKDTTQIANRAIHLLADFEQYGMVFKKSSIVLKGFSPGYKQLFEEFLDHIRKAGMAQATIRNLKSRFFRFEYYLHKNNVDDFSKIEMHHVLTYVESLSCFSAGTVCMTLHNLRKLFDYAIENGKHHTNYVDLLPPVHRIKKCRLPNVYTPDEVERILSTVDRNNPLGKRNYAVLITVAKLGLRISDVRDLRFSNIDWQKKILSIIQRKTGVPLVLPLLEDVGWAIIDYLRNGRPETSCEFVFIKHVAPFDQLSHSFRDTVLQHVRKAGITIPVEKPIGMHSFRHSIATTMLKNGASYTDIAQTLGHASPESAETYLSLDEDQLRQCALEVIF
jgi:site-specific recombinase XerD